LPGFFSIPVVTSSNRGSYYAAFSFRFRGFSTGVGGDITCLFLLLVYGLRRMDRKPGTLYILSYELGETRANFHIKKSDNNLFKIISKTLFSVHSSFCGFFYSYSHRKTWKVPTRYRTDTGENS
jgi:hypothetical protein